MIQRRARQFHVLHRHHNTSSVTDMLQTEVEIPNRPKNWRKTMYKIMSKITNSLVNIPAIQYVIYVNIVTRKQHSLSYIIPHSRCNHHLYFIRRTI